MWNIPVQRGKGSMDFVLNEKVVKKQVMRPKMVYYLILTTHKQVLITYWMIQCQLGHELQK